MQKITISFKWAAIGSFFGGIHGWDERISWKRQIFTNGYLVYGKRYISFRGSGRGIVNLDLMQIIEIPSQTDTNPSTSSLPRVYQERPLTALSIRIKNPTRKMISPGSRRITEILPIFFPPTTSQFLLLLPRPAIKVRFGNIENPRRTRKEHKHIW